MAILRLLLGWQWFECFSFIHQVRCGDFFSYSLFPLDALQLKINLTAIILTNNFFFSCHNFSDENLLVTKDSTINTHLISNDPNRFLFIRSMED